MLTLKIIFSVQDSDGLINILTNFAGIAFVSEIDDKIIELYLTVYNSILEIDLEDEMSKEIEKFNKKIVP